MVGDLFEVRGVDVFAQKRNGELHRYKRVLMLATGFTDPAIADEQRAPHLVRGHVLGDTRDVRTTRRLANRSEEHTSELQSLMRNSYAVFCLKKKKISTHT